MLGGKIIYDVSVPSSPPYRYWCSQVLSDYDDKRPSMQCTLMTENECRISFSVVGSDTGTTAYNLQMNGKLNDKIENRSNKREFKCVPTSHPLSCHRLSWASQHPHDYSGGFPLRRVYRSDPAGCVEGAGVGSRPQRGGQVWGWEVKGEVADGKTLKLLSNMRWFYLKDKFYISYCQQIPWKHQK